jgi:hypothetical protein
MLIADRRRRAPRAGDRRQYLGADVADAASRRLFDTLRGGATLPRLVFEMTEFGVIRAPALSLDFAAEVRRLGAQFAIDHFSLHGDSLRQLHTLLPHYIKLAPAYTNELAENQDSRFIVSSLIRIAQALEIGIIAQAVESEALILLLEELGFAGYQGYAADAPAIAWGLFRICIAQGGKRLTPVCVEPPIGKTTVAAPLIRNHSRLPTIGALPFDEATMTTSPFLTLHELVKKARQKLNRQLGLYRRRAKTRTR